jgi:hypothetical protein
MNFLTRCVIRHTSHLTRHTSHVTRLTSHVSHPPLKQSVHPMDEASKALFDAMLPKDRGKGGEVVASDHFEVCVCVCACVRSCVCVNVVLQETLELNCIEDFKIIFVQPQFYNQRAHQPDERVFVCR